MNVKSILIWSSVFILGTQMACKHDLQYDVCYQTQVQPILKSNCAMSGCHDAITAEKDIRLDTYENVIKEVKAGSPNSSELYTVIKSPFGSMPPSSKAQLTPGQIEIIRSWIAQGAKNDPTCQ